MAVSSRSSSFSIRRLMPQQPRRPSVEDCMMMTTTEADSMTSFFDHDDDENTETSKWHRMYRPRSSSRGIASGGQRPTKKPKPIIVLRSSSAGTTRMTAPFPSMPDTPRSSASSLCSCDYHEGSPERSRLGHKSPSLCSPRSKDRNRSRSPLPPPQQFSLESPPLPTPATSPKKNNEKNGVLHHSNNNSNNSVNITFTAPHPLLESALQKQMTPRSSEEELVKLQGVQALSDNLQQLIRETDQAFTAQDGPLELKSPVTPMSPTFTRPRAVPSPAKLRTNLPRTGKKGSPASPAVVTPTLKSPIHKSALTSKPKRRNSNKKTRRRDYMMSRTKAPPVPKLSSRWTLSDNVSDLFDGGLGGLFSKAIEADEILPQSQLQEILRVNRHPAKKSTENLAITEPADAADTPVEPFHLEESLSRITAANNAISVPSPIEEVPTPKSFEFNLAAKYQAQDSITPTATPPPTANLPPTPGPSPPATAPLEHTQQLLSGDERTLSKSHTFPAPAPQPAGQDKKIRFAHHTRAASNPLPTIPEVMVTPADSTSTLAAEYFDDYIYFKSPPLSMNMPTFLQGPIRLAKADLTSVEQPVMDNTLDWTAFQMAILGGAGDFFSDSVDFSRSNDSEIADDLVEWFAGLGLDGPGALCNAPTLAESDPFPPAYHHYQPQASPTLTPTTSSASASVDSPEAGKAPATPEMMQVSDLPIPLSRGTSCWSEGKFDVDRFYSSEKVAANDKPVRQSVEMLPRTASMESMPQSPMLDLVVNKGTNGEEYVVPMGFNLGHDLGDFLKWEAENVYAGGFGSYD